MSITNQNKPVSSIANSIKTNTGETWDSNSSTWNTETRTWDWMASKISNLIKVLSSMTNVAKPI